MRLKLNSSAKIPGIIILTGLAASRATSPSSVTQVTSIFSGVRIRAMVSGGVFSSNRLTLRKRQIMSVINGGVLASFSSV